MRCGLNRLALETPRLYNHATAIGSSLAMGYYADGQRMWKAANGTPTYYLNQGSGIPACEFNDSGSITAFNTVGANGLLSRSTGSGSSWTNTYYAFDFRGNTVNRLNASGTVLSDATYKAYNTRRFDISNGDPYDGMGGQFGYYKDVENIYLCGQRYYIANQGRWLNRDPIGYAGGINVYSYAGNNPIDNVDPSGLDALILWGRNKDNPAYFHNLARTYAEDYIQDAGNAIAGGSDDVGSQLPRASVVHVETLGDIRRALQTHDNIDTLIYVGHASAFALYLSDKELLVKDVAGLPTATVLPGARIGLYGCDTGGSTGTNSVNIGQAFANRFNTTVVAADGHLSFGAPIYGFDLWPGLLRPTHAMVNIGPGGHAGSSPQTPRRRRP
jgi:RHS repeat-associated protein